MVVNFSVNILGSIVYGIVYGWRLKPDQPMPPPSSITQTAMCEFGSYVSS